MKYIDDLELIGKTVFIRADLNVPLDTSLNITDDHRIKASLPTLQYARECGAKVVLASHLGRPKGEANPEFSLKPVAARLGELIGSEVQFASDCIGKEVEELARSLNPGEVLLLENLRFHQGETKNDEAFAEGLSKLADVYVNDAFATAHRAHASTAGIAKFFEVKGGGFTLKTELEHFEKVFASPERPLAAIFGGAKVSSKIDAIRNVSKKADLILIGGTMANTFFKAMGHEVGKSLYEPDLIENARAIQAEAKAAGCTLVLPEDVVIGEALREGVATRTVGINEIPAEQMALDIGPKSVSKFKQALDSAKTIIWNGPMGAFETKGFEVGTFSMVDILAESKATTVVGGGDTDLALHQKNAMNKMTYVSTGGGAFLTLLEGKELPAVKALS